jgi:hypothetical protein
MGRGMEGLRHLLQQGTFREDEGAAMNARETYNAIQRGNTASMQEALFELLRQTQVLATATLELAGERQLSTGRDPLTMRNRALLSEFIELREEGS